MDTSSIQLRLEPLDTKEKREVYGLAEIALSMRLRYPGSLLWRMRAKQALQRMEQLWGTNAVL